MKDIKNWQRAEELYNELESLKNVIERYESYDLSGDYFKVSVKFVETANWVPISDHGIDRKLALTSALDSLYKERQAIFDEIEEL